MAITIFNKTYENFYGFWADIKAQEVTKDMSPEEVDKLFDIAATIYDEEEEKVARDREDEYEAIKQAEDEDIIKSFEDEEDDMVEYEIKRKRWNPVKCDESYLYKKCKVYKKLDDDWG